MLITYIRGEANSCSHTRFLPRRMVIIRLNFWWHFRNSNDFTLPYISSTYSHALGFRHTKSQIDNMLEKCKFTNIIDQAKDNELMVVGGWEFELVKRGLAKIVISL